MSVRTSNRRGLQSDEVKIYSQRYQMIELMDSVAMTGALKRVKNVKAIDDIK